ncbi:hypothetical protein EB796_008616 [Bugula neritina]|uniref:Uncharacterized protein n=1 Tax=Bugula neritina TaxID=10212 RepID=A0A7J7K4F0_BUGNE|nr:hypothetical protein EB796_008616 [Bugula neritina]
MSSIAEDMFSINQTGLIKWVRSQQSKPKLDNIAATNHTVYEVIDSQLPITAFQGPEQQMEVVSGSLSSILMAHNSRFCGIVTGIGRIARDIEKAYGIKLTVGEQTLPPKDCYPNTVVYHVKLPQWGVHDSQEAFDKALKEIAPVATQSSQPQASLNIKFVGLSKADVANSIDALKADADLLMVKEQWNSASQKPAIKRITEEQVSQLEGEARQIQVDMNIDRNEGCITIEGLRGDLPSIRERLMTSCLV